MPQVLVFTNPADNLEFASFTFNIPDGDAQWEFMEEVHNMLDWLGVKYNNVEFKDNKVIIVAERRKD